MKTTNFFGWAATGLSGGLTGKITQFSEGDMDGIWVSFRLICAIFSVNRAGKVNTLYVVFEGSQSSGGCWVQLSGWPAWRLIEFLQEMQLKKTCLVLLHYSGRQSIESMAGWWSDYQREVWSSKLQKNDYVCEWVKDANVILQTHTNMTWQRDDSNQPDTHVQDDWLMVWATSVTLMIDHWLTMMTLVW